MPISACRRSNERFAEIEYCLRRSMHDHGTGRKKMIRSRRILSFFLCFLAFFVLKRSTWECNIEPVTFQSSKKKSKKAFMNDRLGGVVCLI